MRLFRTVAIFIMCVLACSVFAAAKQNQFGVADKRNLELFVPTWVGGVLLPVGDYVVLHTMEGQDHIMVFKQINKSKAAEARVKCQLVPLAKAAPGDEQIFTVNPANERVLHTLVFKGDSAQHVF